MGFVEPKRDLWRWPSLALWLVFLAVGVVPEEVYYIIRESAFVVDRRALINSPHMLTLAWAGFFAWFSYRRCVEAGLSIEESSGKALQLGVLGLLAFLAVGPRLILNYTEIIVPEHRWLVLGMGFAKLFAWLYLFSVIMRYYLIDGHGVFRKMGSIFPSMQDPEDSPPSSH